MENRDAEIDALKIAVNKILKSKGMELVRDNLILLANEKINHARSVGDSANYEYGVGANLLKITDNSPS